MKDKHNDHNKVQRIPQRIQSLHYVQIMETDIYFNDVIQVKWLGNFNEM